MRIRQFFVAVMMATAPILAFAVDVCGADDNDNVCTVPEPATLALLAVAAVALTIARVHKRK